MNVRRFPVLVALVAVGAGACVRRPATPTADRSDGAIPSVRAPHVATGAVRVDGRLDEPAWQRAGETGAFVGSGDGRPVRGTDVNATARVTWDDTNLYLGVVVDERSPASPFGRNDVDPHLWERASAVEVMLQPGDPGDNRDYYELQVDVNGAVWDTHFDDYNRPITASPDGQRFGHQEWVANVQRAITVDRGAGHYTLEIA
ncbi:MAG: carbohydrate-binding family 9-like protein, partial [Deltaproteobacteria bacterium]